jgi:coenzyme F420 biosynthesis associated uncharacterized protein
MVDWSLARQIARLAAGSEPSPADLGIDLVATCQELEGPVAGYTRLLPSTPVPRAEPVGREEWIEANLTTLAGMLDPVAERLEQRLEFAGPLAGALKVASRATMAAEAGLVMGYVSQRVLGQYELSLLSGDAPARLLFVAPNLDKAVRRLEVEREPFLRWVCAHELTHVFQFQGVPWLRGHLGALMRRYLESVEVRVERGSAGGLPALPDPGRLVELFREGGLIALVQSRDQRELLSEVQAAMAVVEGYSEHVMDALGEGLIPDGAKLRAAMQRRRANRSAPERVIERLLGLDFKLRQYELGKGFCDAVAAQGGMERLNAVWDSPESLPTLAELERPESWLERTRKPAALSPGRG